MRGPDNFLRDVPDAWRQERRDPDPWQNQDTRRDDRDPFAQKRSSPGREPWGQERRSPGFGHQGRTEPMGQDRRSPDFRRHDRRSPEFRRRDCRSPEFRRQDYINERERSSERRRQEQRSPERWRREQRSPERRRQEQRSPERWRHAQRSPDHRRPEHRSPEQRRRENEDRGDAPVIHWPRGRRSEDREDRSRQQHHSSNCPEAATDEANAPQPQPQPAPAPALDPVSISDLLEPPGRYVRPPRLVVIFRGLPGSGKSHVAKLVKTRETELGTDAPRVLSIDDYFQCDGQVHSEWVHYYSPVKGVALSIFAVRVRGGSRTQLPSELGKVVQEASGRRPLQLLHRGLRQ